MLKLQIWRNRIYTVIIIVVFGYFRNQALHQCLIVLMICGTAVVFTWEWKLALKSSWPFNLCLKGVNYVRSYKQIKKSLSVLKSEESYSYHKSQCYKISVKYSDCLDAELLQTDKKSKRMRRERMFFMTHTVTNEILGCHQKGNFT